jgi:hypothetical protein
MLAFLSLSSVIPHASHPYALSDSFKSFLMEPHPEHVLLEG